MCGICAFVLLRDSSSKEELNFYITRFPELLKHRGPDYFGTKSVECKNGSHLNFQASVLHLRGSSLISQPYCDEVGNVLLWNGEIFNGNLYDEESSDTIRLADNLLEARSAKAVLKIFEMLQGPWAFIYYQKEDELLWFGRDIFGRRSLLVNASSDGSFALSSIALEGLSWEEVPCDGIYCLDIKNSQTQTCLLIKKYLYSRTPSGVQLNRESILNFSQELTVEISEYTICSPIEAQMNVHLPIVEHEIRSHELQDIAESLLKSCLEQPKFASAVSELETLLSNAIQRRSHNHPFICKNCLKKALENSEKCNLLAKCCHSSVGILFSGGLDSIVIAALADRSIPKDVPIDLLNVAFSCPKKKKVNKTRKLSVHEEIPVDVSYDTPDRITGLKGMEELRSICPWRTWNFVMINISREELEQERVKIISNLILPSCTVLDDSMGCAVWFAARGVGILELGDTSISYCSPARILLVGMGADEQLAGYSRHRGKFSAHGWKGLVDELILELDRISSRNLGRDDRIISDHGREARFPFLDENVVSFINQTPVWLKANLNYPRGVGEKLLLRLLAFKLGLKKACILPKRAIQFGSRIARIENAKEKGSNVCERLTSVSGFCKNTCLSTST